ncbi:MAG: prepilin-type N-terminal cleavage/methylation domain-containing protein [Syntrophaceae bacterium]
MPDSSRGFTLIEVLVAMIVLSIPFVTLLVHENRGIDYAMRSKFYTTSTLLAERRVAEVKTATTPMGMGEDKGDFGVDYPGYTYRENLETTPLTGYYKYTLRIFWGGEKSVFENKFITFIAAK